MIKIKRWRQWIAIFHQYLGLAVGLILMIVGLTGSILVFEPEIDQVLLNTQLEKIVPVGEFINPEKVVNQVKQTYQNQPDLTVSYLDLPQDQRDPYKVWLISKVNQWTEVFVNPYTGKILGSRQWEKTLLGLVFRLHYQLLGGDVGVKLVGICGLLLLMLSITGILLWPGWKKLLIGFKIKFNTHPQRLNFDLHKVIGILTAGFLAMIAFTGFCWNFYEITYPTIYGITLSPHPPEPQSTPIPGKSPLSLSQILQKADETLPNAITTSIRLPTQPNDVFRINKRLPGTHDNLGRNQIYLDQYRGEVLYFKDQRSLSLGDQIIDSFVPLHYGTFGGLPSRLLYVVIGLSPTLLAITGFLMRWYRRKAKKRDFDTFKNREFLLDNPQKYWPLAQWPWF